MAKKTKKSPTRLGRRVIKKTASRVPARKKAKSKARTSSQGTGLSRLKKGKSKNDKSRSTAVKKRVRSKPVRVIRKHPKKTAKLVKRSGKLRKSVRSAKRANVGGKRVRDSLGRFRAHKVIRAKRKPKRAAFTLRDETKIITCGGKGREVPLLGEFELQKRTMSFKAAPPRVDKLPYQKQITSEATKFFDDHGQGTYFFKTKISLQTDDGELVERWFTPFARRQHDSAESFSGDLDDLNLTMQEMARGYLKDSYENYRLEDIELEYIDASKLIPPKETG